MNGKREIKCANCRQWTLWRGELYDRCLHCDAFLLKDAFTEKVEKDILRQVKNENELISVRPDDSAWMRFLRKTLSYLQIAFVSFISFLLWLISLLAG